MTKFYQIKGDAFIYYSIIKSYKPNKIIEIGSGFSSGFLLDVIEYEKNKPKITFIDPNPSRLKKLIKKKDSKNIEIYEKMIQDIKVSIFKDLNANDIIFIDSSHIAKSRSDILFSTLFPD
ncbi:MULTISPECIES: class I SAM-dependent methyltransferase [unclassified Acinetobacter]|uniref:class I SAM-dependent methyltransferase n=1 Tax=unclassified Acinetobacter TaxID=196816 RepID=UPI0029342D15|nr:MULTISPECIES: class I SAM-dependent methyltransferase [unclassified Acinetobacter]WOE33275.1 hypothetical protein QSG84_16080 [Acinetobacter sp. SAAs470]WOE36944.1 hypothetical protein QSG86_00805 [Acinetobacter sp. SAAs474]